MSPTDTQSMINACYTPPSTASQHASEEERLQSPSGVPSSHFGASMTEQLNMHLVEEPADPISHSAPLAVQDLDANSTLLHTETIASLRAQGDLNTGSTASQAKDLYLNGNGARLPKVRRAKATRKQSSILHLPANQYGSFAFPVSRSTTPDLEDKSLQIRAFLMEGTWQDMLEKFQRYCLTPSALFPPFTSSEFPSRREFEVMISTHFDSFHQVLPIIHMPTLSLGCSNWILALGIATSGAHFVERNSKSELVAAMHEFLQRALIHEGDRTNSSLNEIVTVKILHSVGMMFSGSEELVQRARRWRMDLISSFHDNNASEPMPTASFHDQADLPRAWLSWAGTEHRRRSAYAIWMIDSMWGYLLEEHSFLSSKLPEMPLPCAEVLWEANTANQWCEVTKFADATPSMKDAVEKIFIHREVQSTLGEYSRVLLVHGLYHHMAHIRNLLQSEANWAGPTEIAEELPWTIWPPTVSSYRSWREATCDCLDVLHWRANSVTGAASGLEHPTIAHLHLSRIVLLAPISYIRALAKSAIDSNDGVHPEKTTVAAAKVRSWVEDDCHKARLCIIHAGVTFWHLRRFSVGAFYETDAVVLAALTLWAFALFSGQPAVDVFSPDSQGTASATDNPLPASINLDRPCDDELVQSFIEEGTRIPAMIGGVGEICSPMGPRRILWQAMDILRGFHNWGNTTRSLQFLHDLSQVQLSGDFA
ncbi:hypothetical protein IQ07DRAFT_646337 [Pyrenochaeta sp. DS3sAY3a]|nr:hypothetical protein IQ07DRAFT_646337 [Pyrenochaeta sp. DS3sAY3a]